MNEIELRVFVSVADAGCLDVAAQSMGATQPAIRYQLMCLEKTLGIRLWERDASGSRLTRCGQMILPSARAALVLFDSIRQSGR